MNIIHSYLWLLYSLHAANNKQVYPIDYFVFCLKLNTLFRSCKLIDFQGNFDIEEKSTSQGLPYDFTSIMHVRHNAFSCEFRCKSTVLPRNISIPTNELGRCSTGTDFDFLHINLLYCGGKAAKDPSIFFANNS